MTSPKNLLKLRPTIRRRCHRSATRIHPIGPQRRTFQSPQTALLPATSAQTELVVNDAAASSLASCPTKATPLFGHQGMSAAERREMLRLVSLKKFSEFHQFLGCLASRPFARAKSPGTARCVGAECRPLHCPVDSNRCCTCPQRQSDRRQV